MQYARTSDDQRAIDRAADFAARIGYDNFLFGSFFAGIAGGIVLWLLLHIRIAFA